MLGTIALLLVVRALLMGVWMCGDRLRKRPSQLINRTNHQRRIGSIIFFFSLCYTTLTKHYLFEVMDTREQKDYFLGH